VLGSTEPRLWTPPLRELTPATSRGFDQIEFARDVLLRPADPWQEWLLIHAGELLPDGRPRFRIVLVLVSRQNGKTETPVILSAYWQFVQGVPLILGTSTKLEYAKESWGKAVKLVEAASELDDLRPVRWKRETNGEQESWTHEGSRYKIAASNAEGGRSLTVHRLILDELRQHHDYSAWDAAVPAMNAVSDAQAWCLSNAGDDRSIVLNDLRESALRFIETGEGDPRLGIFEWSAPEDADPEDLAALAQANPNLGRRIDPEVLLGDARRAVLKGGEVLAGFKTESMCIRVKTLGTPPPISEELWLSLHDAGSQLAGDVALAVDVAPDQGSAAIAVYGPRSDGRGHLEVIAVRAGVSWVVPAVAKLKTLHNPIAIGLFGAAGALLAPLAKVGITPPADRKRPMRGDLAVPYTSDLAEAWGGFLVAVSSDDLRHRDQVPLTAAVGHAKVKKVGEAEGLDRRASTGDVGPLNAAIGSRWAYVTRADKILGDLVYEDFDPAVHVVDRFDIPEAWPRYLAVRFGFVAPFTAQWWAEDPDGALWMYREIYGTGRLVEEHAETILRLSRGEPAFTALIADHDAEDRPTLQRHLGMGSTAAKKSVSDGVQAFASRLKAQRLFLLRDSLVERDRTLAAAELPTCLAEEIPGYVWAPGKESPVEEHDAGCTAARYLVASKDLRKRAGTRGWI
jgi:hypothetical protein